MKQGITGKTGITLRAVAVVSISAAVALVIVLGGPGVRQDVADRAAAVQTPAAENNAPMTRAVRTVAITAQPLPTWPTTTTDAVAEPAHPSSNAGDSGSNQGKQEGPAADPHLQGRLVPHQTSDNVCARHGGHREDYQRGSGWRGWRCVFPTKATKETKR